MRGSAYLWALLLSSSCSVSSPCLEQGGLCTRSETECPPDLIYVGFDPSCEPMSKCCVRADGRPVDGGTTGCTTKMGKCQKQEVACTMGMKSYGQPGLCPAGNHCCAP